MDKINVTFPSGTTLPIARGTKTADLLQYFSEDSSAIIAVKINNQVCSLERPIDVESALEPIFFNSKQGSQVYRRSLCFLLAAAAHKVFPGSRLLVGHSLGYGYYYTLETGNPIQNDDIAALKKEMTALINRKLPIKSELISYEQATVLFEKLGLIETRRQLDYRCPPRIQINTIKEFSDMYFGPLVMSTGCLSIFDLMPYH
ncbi:MAG: nucleoside kinase, partial [Treponema sp.]|nr:nucleoside kinase [Treponema sp.]